MSLKPENLRFVVDNPPPIGGQHAGLTPRGVTVVHIPTGMRAYCASGRSELWNRRICESMLEYGLLELGWTAG